MKKAYFKTIDEYIAGFPPETKEILSKIRKTIHAVAPQATEAISYQMPTFKVNGKNLVHFAGWKDHIGFYPTPSGTEKFKKQLSEYTFSKGTIRFSLNQDIRYDLIQKIVAFRLEEIKK